MKKPRTRENYPNQLLNIHGKIRPDIVDWIIENHWTLRLTKSGLVGKMITFAHENQEEFAKFLKSND